MAKRSAEFRAAVRPEPLTRLANSLGLTEGSLHHLSIGWAEQYKAWSFPMVNADGAVLGVRLRRPDGTKLSVRGGREGLFIPSSVVVEQRLLICEGPTDTAALLDLGFQAVVGRPSCSGGVKLLVDLIQRWRSDEVVIIADADEPGKRGADNLAAVLAVYVPSVRIVVPKQAKDMREFLRAGGTKERLEQAVADAPERRLTVQSWRADHVNS